MRKRFKLHKIFITILILYVLFLVFNIVVSGFLATMNTKPAYLRRNYLAITGISIVFHTFFLYFSLNRFYVLLTRKKRFIHFVPVFLLMTIAYIAYQYLSDSVFNESDQAFNKKMSTAFIFVAYVINFILFCAVTFVISYLYYLRDEKKHRAVLEKQKTALEVEKAHADLNFLKAQINPHFLHNTLNFLYAKSIPYSPELSEGILTLSEIMRYALSDNRVRDGKAALRDEIEHVRNVIRINQLRFSNNLKVNFEVRGVINGATIIPFVLITLVENAFKHGDVKSAEFPVDIQLTVKDEQLSFYCRNKKKTGPKEISTGIGLDNIRKRLALAYGEDHLLVITDEQDFYTTRLTILAL